jgi:hypothetical protein
VMRRRDAAAWRSTALLVAAGERQWACVPTPCPGLQAALIPVWKKAPKETVDEDLRQLFERLELEVQFWLQEALRALHHGARPFDSMEEPLRMKILQLALE